MRHERQLSLPFEKLSILDEVAQTVEALRKFEVDICRALEYGNNSHSFDDIVVRVLAGHLDLYPFPNSVIIMELTEYPNYKVYHGFIAAGNLDEIVGAHEMMFREARLRGAKYLSIAGRKGWERVMKQHGWDHKLSIMQIEVPNGKDDY